MGRIAAAIAAAGVLAAAVFAAAGGSTGVREASAGGLIARGKALYQSYSCNACHTIDGSGGAGPTFKHLYGSRVKLTNGKTVTANDVYLIRAIEDPDGQIVAGRPAHVMTQVIKKGQVPRRNTLALIAFIKSLR